MIVPGRHAILAAVILGIALIGAVVDPRIALIVLAADVAVVLVVWLAGRRLRTLPIEIRRGPAPKAQVGREQDLAFEFINRSGSDLIVRIHQPTPPGTTLASDTIDVAVGAGEMVRAALRLTPNERGRIELPAGIAEVRATLADLARARHPIEVGHLRVFPTMKGLNAMETLRHHHASALAGAHRQRMIGSGRDFEQLREYLPDDDFREVNWKATARQNRPITNVYQAERSQDVLLCLDCGRMMGNPVGQGSALDHAIDAAVLLAHVANRGGDRVGMILFRDIVTRVLKPAGGMSAITRLLEQLVDAHAEPVFPSFSALTSALRANQTRRAFVFIFTDLNDPQLAANLSEVLPLISRRHAVTIISLRDPLVDQVAAGPAKDQRGLYQVLAAGHISQERATRVRELQKRGASVIEADAGSISTQSINAYLEAKARQLV